MIKKKCLDFILIQIMFLIFEIYNAIKLKMHFNILTVYKIYAIKFLIDWWRDQTKYRIA